MAFDERLAQEAVLLVRLFTWEPPAVSFGCRQPRPEWFDEVRWRGSGLEWVERPTGGGIALHGSDVSLAVVVPRAIGLPLDQLMDLVCQSAVRLCRSYGLNAAPQVQTERPRRITYCLTELSPYAVSLDPSTRAPDLAEGSRSGFRPTGAMREFGGLHGYKVGGFALRRYRESWLIQGSLLVRPLPRRLIQAIPREVADALGQRALSLAEASATPVTESDAMRRWAAHWGAWWEELLLEQLGVLERLRGAAVAR